MSSRKSGTCSLVALHLDIAVYNGAHNAQSVVEATLQTSMVHAQVLAQHRPTTNIQEARSQEETLSKAML